MSPGSWDSLALELYIWWLIAERSRSNALCCLIQGSASSGWRHRGGVMSDPGSVSSSSSSALVLLELNGLAHKCDCRCSITNGVIGGISITRWRKGSGSSLWSKMSQRRQESRRCSTTSSTRSICSSGPYPAHKPGSWAQLRELRQIRNVNRSVRWPGR